MCAMPRNRPVGRLHRRPADVDLGGQRGRELGLADAGQRLGDGGVRRQDHRLGGHHAAGGVLGVGQQPAQRAPPRRAPSARAASRPRPAAARRAGRRRRRAASPRARRRRAPPRACRGSRPGRPRAAPRGRRRASRRRARRRPRAGASGDSSCRTVARSAALSFSKVASRLAAPWPVLLERRSRSTSRPVDGQRLAAAAQALARPPDEQPGHRPVAGALLLHADVLDRLPRSRPRARSRCGRAARRAPASRSGAARSGAC